MRNARQIKIIALNSLADIVSQADPSVIDLTNVGVELDDNDKAEIVRLFTERRDKFLDALEGTVDRNSKRLEARMKRRQARDQQQAGVRKAREEKLAAKEQRKKDREEKRQARIKERTEARDRGRDGRGLRGSNQFEKKEPPSPQEKAAETRRQRSQLTHA